ncbi:Type I Iterative PKS [Bacidia gigantensis]|uniref:Type I Iterative PKS n=1 Tax=Bacidia gigantensis TaxID=2732470 RepID=UPI001D048923|nr:Type I Iterative PKS [Bacidia gigantensis]KAG8531294.1 Type I Iterative PKS [Bacidia gigantensis]
MLEDPQHALPTGVDKNKAPVAIIGLACRFPGDAVNPQSFWEVLCNARSAYSEPPESRFHIDAFHTPNRKKQDTIRPRGGHFLQQDVGAFDANFFSISQNEAISMDPQQRIMLETVYEAFENACLPLDTVAGTDTGCFMGNFTTDYREMMFRDFDSAPTYAMSGSGQELISNRVSWFYDLKGPSFTLGTACSSSLVALHQACRAIEAGECSMAVVGATNLLLNPEMFMALSNQNFLAKDGRCRSFDAAGDGYGRGEGFSAIILKNVNQAILDGDPLRAVIRGTGVNQNGRTKAITQTNAKAQAELIKSTYRLAGLNFQDTNYFEAHIGHLEATAGLAALIKGIFILENGLIPPNINLDELNPRIPFREWKVTVPTTLRPWPTEGLRRLSTQGFGYGGTNAHVILDDAFHYLETIKQEGNHFTKTLSSPAIPLSTSRSKIATKHDSKALKRKRVFVLTAQDKDGIDRQRQNLHQHLMKKERVADESSYLRDLAFTLSKKRTKLAWRTYTGATSLKELTTSLQASESTALTMRPTKPPRIGFVFTGQGAQWPRMGLELLEYTVFRKSIEEANDYLKIVLNCSWSVLTELSKDASSSKIDQPAYSQTLCTVLQVALVDLLESWGITPSAIVGHSSGEIAGAYCLGALSRQDAWKIAYMRGLLSSEMKSTSPPLLGGMLAVGTSKEDAESWISQYPESNVVVACVNSPSSVTISGNESGIIELESALKDAGIFARRLKVEIAYHSPHMEAIQGAYLHSMSGIYAQEGHTERRMYSAVSGSLVDGEELGPVNWVRNLVSPVLFYDAVRELLQPTTDRSSQNGNAVDVLVEIGPHSALKGPANQTMQKHGVKGVDYLSFLSRGANAIDTAMIAVGELFSRGSSINISRANNDVDSANQPLGKPLVDLPSYSWNHSRTYWAESRISRQHRFRKEPLKSLIGPPCPNYGESERLWRGILRLADEPWIQNHTIQSTVLYPAAGYLAMAIEGASQIATQGKDIQNFRLKDVQIVAPAVIKEDSPTEFVLQIRPHHRSTKDDWFTWSEFTVSSSAEGGDLRKNCNGLLLIEYDTPTDSASSIEQNLEEQHALQAYEEYQTSCQTVQKTKEFYENLDRLGLSYGPLFQNVTKIQSTENQSCCEVTVSNAGISEIPHEQFVRPHVIHPSTLDAMFHAIFAAYNHKKETMKEAMVPKSIDEITIYAKTPFEAGSQFKGFSTASKHGFREMKGSLTMLDKLSGKRCVTMKDLLCTAIPNSSVSEQTQTEVNAGKLYSQEIWRPALDLCSTAEKIALMKGSTSTKPSRTSSGSAESSLTASSSTSLTELTYYSSVETSVAAKKDPLYDSSRLSDLPNQFQQPQTAPERFGPIDDEKLNPQPVDCTDNENANEISNNKPIANGEGWPNLPDLIKQSDTDLTPSLTQNQGIPSAYMHHADICWRQLYRLLKLMSHNKPSLSVYEIGSSTFRLDASLLSSEDPFVQSIDFTLSLYDEEALAHAKESMRARQGRTMFTHLDPDTSSSTIDEETSAYDLIILSDLVMPVKRLRSILEKLPKILNSGGKICFYQRSSAYSTSDESRDFPLAFADSTTFQDILRIQDFTVDFRTNDSDLDGTQNFGLLLARTKLSIESIPTHPKVHLLQPTISLPKTARFASCIENELKESGVDVINVQWNSNIDSLEISHCISLLELDSPILSDCDQQEFCMLQNVILRCTDLLWITAFEGPAAALVPGMFRTLRNEVQGNQYRTLRLEPMALNSPEKHASTVAKLLTTSATDHEFLEEDGKVTVCRYIKDTPMNDTLSSSLVDEHEVIDQLHLEQIASPHKLGILKQGMLDTLCLEADDDLNIPIKGDEIDIHVKATGLNFRDVMVIMGQIPDDLLGFEASGIVTRCGRDVTQFKAGDKVCALGHGAHRTVFRNKAIFCQKIPENLSFEEAATIPLVHCTSHHALMDVAHARSGQSILIHAAAGGVGQSAIQLAKYLDLEIFATVGSPEKRDLLERSYGIKSDHIFNSRDTSFAKGVMRMTKGKGVDIILNSLSGESLRLSWECIANFGTFVEIGMKDILVNTGLDMQPFSRGATFSFFNIKHIMTDNPIVVATLMQSIFDNIRDGIVQPVSPVKTYQISDVESAFRLLQTGRHQGKIALQWESTSPTPVLRRQNQPLHLRPDATYVLVGGLGGLGRSLTHLLVDSGAKHLSILSRSGPSSKAAQALIAEMKNTDVQISIHKCDIACWDEISRAFQQITSSMPPIKGAFQCAMVLQDRLFETMSHFEWSTSLRPKVQGSWNVHDLLPSTIDFFILLSSFAALIGNRTQSNYAAAGAYLDALAHYRRARGLKAISVDLGVMRDVGVIAEHGATDYLKEWEVPFGMREREFHALMKAVIAKEMSGNANALPAQIVHGLATGEMVRVAGVRTPYYHDDPRFAMFAGTGELASSDAALSLSKGEAAAASAKSLQEQLTQATDIEEATKMITDALVARVAKSLVVEKTEIDDGRPLYSYGVDSLVGIEIANWVFQQTKVKFSVFDILATASIVGFARDIAEKSEGFKK